MPVKQDNPSPKTRTTNIKGGDLPSGGGSGSALSDIDLSRYQPEGIGGSDFYRPQEITHVRCGMVFGDAGTGKTTFSLHHCPEPVYYINLDSREGDVLEEAIKELKRDILYVPVDYPAQVTKLADAKARALAQEAVDKVSRNVAHAASMSRKTGGTIILDTGTEYDDILKIAIKGRVDRTPNTDYGDSKTLMDREWLSLFNIARRGGAGLIVLAREKDVWQSTTGQVTHKISKCVYSYCDWVARIAVKMVKVPGTKEKNPVFSLEVTKAGGKRAAIEELGAIYTSDEWEYLGGPYTYMMDKLYPEDK